MCVKNEFTTINPSRVSAPDRASILKIRTTLRRMYARDRLIHAAASLSSICDILIVWFFCEQREYVNICLILEACSQEQSENERWGLRGAQTVRRREKK